MVSFYRNITMKEMILPDDDLALALRALGHPVRLDILRILARKCNNQCCCTDVTECLPLAQSTVSQHIKVLFEAGLVERQARGTRNCYTVCTERLDVLKAAYEAYLAGLFSNSDTQDPAPLPESV